MDDFEHAARVLDGIAHEVDHLTDAELLEIGHAATTVILLRTKQGIDVEGKPFAPYSPEYAKERREHGLSDRPDLAVKGHMLGAMVPAVTAPGEVTIRFANPLEATKAAVHNFGNKSTSQVASHSRSAFVDKTGKRVSRSEVKRDSRRKNKRLSQRTESVSAHQRKQNTPQREFMDIRQPREIETIERMVGVQITTRVEKVTG